MVKADQVGVEADQVGAKSDQVRAKSDHCGDNKTSLAEPAFAKPASQKLCEAGFASGFCEVVFYRPRSDPT